MLAWAPVAVVAAVPMVVDPWGWDRFGPSKAGLATAVVGAAIVGMALSGRLRWHRAIWVAWSGVLTVTALSSAVSPDPLLSLIGEGSRMFGLSVLILGFAAFVVGCSAQASPRTVSRALVAGCVPVAAVGLLQSAGWDLLAGGSELDVTRARSTFGNAAFLGGYLAIVLPVAAAIAADDRESTRWRVVGGAAFVLAASGLAVTGTRGAWIAGLVGLAVAGWTLRERARLWVVACAVAAVASAAAAIAITPAPGRFGPTTHDTVSGRIDTWILTTSVVAERPVLGWGPEGFRSGFARVVTRDWVRSYGMERIPDRAHNLFADTAAATGVAGLLAFVVLVATAVRAVWREMGLRSPPVVGLVAGCFAYLVHTQFLFDTLEGGILVWTVLGVVVSSQTATIRPPLAVSGFVVAAVTGMLAVSTASIVSDRIVARAVVAPAAADAVDRIAVAARIRPRTVDHHTLAVSIAVNHGDEEALRAARMLHEGWDDPDVLLALAEVQARLGAVTRNAHELETAAADFRRALRVQPVSGRGWLGFGETLVRLGEGVEAQQALERAADLLPRSVFPHANLALLALADDDVSGARGHLRDAARIDPDHPVVRDLQTRVAR